MSALAEALVAALAELTGVEKGRTAKVKMKQGGEYTYSYANIADVIEATRPVLAQNGLVALTPVSGYGEADLCVTVELVHTSGESKVFDPLPFSPGSDAQASGSAITYFRRYALLAALGMAAEDDDGAAAKERPRKNYDHGRPARGQSSDSQAPTEKQAEFARSLAAKFGDAAAVVVPDTIEKVTGRRVKLADLNRGELSAVIEELKAASADVVSRRDAEATARADAGEEPFAEDERPFTDE